MIGSLVKQRLVKLNRRRDAGLIAITLVIFALASILSQVVLGQARESLPGGRGRPRLRGYADSLIP